QRLLRAISEVDDNTRNLLPYGLWHEAVERWKPRVVVALILSVLGFIFWSVFRGGFRRRVIQISVVVVATYLVLSAVIIVSSLLYLRAHPDLLQNWWAGLPQEKSYPAGSLFFFGGWASVIVLCLVSFPKMSLGLSGFELSMVVVPLVRGSSAGKA